MVHPVTNKIPAAVTHQLLANNTLATVTINEGIHIIKAYLPSHSDRTTIENYIAEVFKHKFSASLNEFMPLLVTFEQEDGSISAALGIRFADQQTLFAEQYTQKEIDHVVLEQFNILDKREHIVEIGSLASTQSGYARHLFLAMTKILTQWRYQWLTFTAIPAVLNVFRKLRLNPVELCNATLKDLINTTTDWGNYYDKNPKVMIGDVFSANTYLEQHHGYRNMSFQTCSYRQLKS